MILGFSLRGRLRVQSNEIIQGTESPVFSWALDAALKRRSSTVLPALISHSSGAASSKLRRMSQGSGREF